MQLIERDKRALKLGAAVVVVILGAAISIGPVGDRWTASGREYDELEARSLRLVQNAARRQQKQAEITQLQQRIGLFEQPLAYDGQVTRLDKNVSEAAKRAGVQLQTTRRVEAQPSRVLPNYDLAGLRTQLQAPMAQVIKFLHELQYTAGVFSIESVELSADAKNPQQVSAQIHISTLVVPAEKKRGKA